MNQIPVTTQWTLDAAGDTGRASIPNVYMILCQSTNSKGSGFLIDKGFIITNHHVIAGCVAKDIVAISSVGKRISIEHVWFDVSRDLAVLKPAFELKDGLTLSESINLKVGESVTTWGFPLGYSGPAPLLSVGYLAGFTSYPSNNSIKKHLVVNGAFNSGNSGGALFSGDKVVGVVVSKHAPISQYHQQAIAALVSNQSGVTFTATNELGAKKTLVESQIVAEILTHFRSLTQVMIGEAIAVEELIAFLAEIENPKKKPQSRNSQCHCGSGKRYKDCCGKLMTT